MDSTGFGVQGFGYSLNSLKGAYIRDSIGE